MYQREKPHSDSRSAPSAPSQVRARELGRALFTAASGKPERESINLFIIPLVQERSGVPDIPERHGPAASPGPAPGPGRQLPADLEAARLGEDRRVRQRVHLVVQPVLRMTHASVLQDTRGAECARLSFSHGARV